MKTYQDANGVGYVVHDVAIRANVDEAAKAVLIFILAEGAISGQKAAAVNLVMKPTEEGEAVDPVMEVTQEQAEELMADLWHCGIRPKDVDLSDQGAMKATKAHLEDTRMIMMALWNKLNGYPTSIGPVTTKPQKALKLPDPPDQKGGAEIKNPKGPKNEANLPKGNRKGKHNEVAPL